ncbi:hypothetical protein SHKM778_70250 [Streptomyces sp. KM77-8]|uniref:Uncharacterized protein n=1 Tax=Streptomyces haneummycinicus TaxID=3074435 RepID=A0AAT9HTE3_9ACTN
MTTQTTAATPAAAPAENAPTGLIGIPPHIGRALATGGSVLAVVSTFLAWTWTDEFPGDLTFYGYPGGLQVLVLVGGVLATLFALASYGVKGLGWLTPPAPTRPSSTPYSAPSPPPGTRSSRSASSSAASSTWNPAATSSAPPP